ncbi:MAG: zf-HC2 domain-containing protein [Pseudomonadota bacterium]
MGLMKTCKETSLLVTQSLDRKLNWHENLAMRLHLAICENCYRFMKQMHLIREWLSREDEAVQPGLSEEGRERIARNLREKE